MSDVGHNSEITGLKSFVERIERLEEEKRGLAADVREVYAEAKGCGFDVKALREVVKLRRMDAAERREREELVELYKRALGMLDGTPLGAAAVRRAVKGLGTPVEPTAEEKAKGVVAAFEDKDGRMSIAVPKGKPAKVKRGARK